MTNLGRFVAGGCLQLKCEEKENGHEGPRQTNTRELWERSSQMGLGWQREREDSEAEIAEKMAQVICAKPRMNWGKVLSRRANDQLVENEGVR